MKDSSKIKKAPSTTKPKNSKFKKELIVKNCPKKTIVAIDKIFFIESLYIILHL